MGLRRDHAEVAEHVLGVRARGLAVALAGQLALNQFDVEVEEVAGSCAADDARGAPACPSACALIEPATNATASSTTTIFWWCDAPTGWSPSSRNSRRRMRLPVELEHGQPLALERVDHREIPRQRVRAQTPARRRDCVQEIAERIGKAVTRAFGDAGVGWLPVLLRGRLSRAAIGHNRRRRYFSRRIYLWTSPRLAAAPPARLRLCRRRPNRTAPGARGGIQSVENIEELIATGPRYPSAFDLSK